MRSDDIIKESVSKAYTQILEKKAAADSDRSAIAHLANYEETVLDSIPDDAVQNSFGCGNPLAFAGVNTGDTVLDLGCGAGIDLLIAAGIVGDEGLVIGVDMTDAMLDKARTNITEAGVNNVDLRKGYIEALPVDNESVDWVISNCVINLSPNKERVFKEIYRALKPGGWMMVSDIIVEKNALPDWITHNPQLYNACLSGAIDESDYIAGLQHAGLDEVTVVQKFYYDVSALQALALGGEIPDVKDFLDELTDDERDQFMQQVATDIEGKVCSAKFRAHKPTF